MATTVSTPQELGKALKNNESKIVVTGSLGPAVMTIEAIGPVAWGVAIVSLGILVAGVLAAVGTGGVATPAVIVTNGLAAPGLVATFGSMSTVATVANIAIAGGGIGVLTSLRRYSAKSECGMVVLSRR